MFSQIHFVFSQFYVSFDWVLISAQFWFPVDQSTIADWLCGATTPRCSAAILSVWTDRLEYCDCATVTLVWSMFFIVTYLSQNLVFVSAATLAALGPHLDWIFAELFTMSVWGSHGQLLPSLCGTKGEQELAPEWYALQASWSTSGRSSLWRPWRMMSTRVSQTQGLPHKSSWSSPSESHDRKAASCNQGRR